MSIIELSMLDAVDICEDITELSIIEDEAVELSIGDEDIALSIDEDATDEVSTMDELAIDELSIIEDEELCASAPVASAAASAAPTKNGRVIGDLRGKPVLGEHSTCDRSVRSGQLPKLPRPPLELSKLPQ